MIRLIENTKKFFSKAIIANIIALLALIFSFFSRCEQNLNVEIQQKSIDSLNYRINSVTYQPVFVIQEKPKLKNVRIEIKAINSETKLELDTITSKYYEALKATIIYHLNGEFTVVNEGNFIGDLVLFGYGVKVDSTALLRQSLYDSLALKNIKTTYFSQFHKTQLLPSDSLVIQFNIDFNDIKNDNTILHFCLLYENQAGQLYDTYYWAALEDIPTTFVQGTILRDRESKVRLVPADYNNINDMFHLNNTNQSYNIYDIKEAKLIRSNLDKYLYQ